jgi:hypothetical protein
MDNFIKELPIVKFTDEINWRNISKADQANRVDDDENRPVTKDLVRMLGFNPDNAEIFDSSVTNKVKAGKKSRKAMLTNLFSNFKTLGARK